MVIVISMAVVRQRVLVVEGIVWSISNLQIVVPTRLGTRLLGDAQLSLARCCSHPVAPTFDAVLKMLLRYISNELIQFNRCVRSCSNSER
jgi:hypothetical protein